ncbi:hypothetical protein Mgra_00003499 [Meloidogyne graminicola]|uniref:Uncharacterized protein n=1 Tax=Meloidogyne graminicola TaxID=189291 RepID=A0A8S9ZVV2_9BILA|nr:hypothetical protein Mgra_00003499 [Meloidogyne graminicola]
MVEEKIHKSEEKLIENSKELSVNSTPEDSESEKEEDNELEKNLIKTELEEYAFLVTLLFEFEIISEDENWIRDRKSLNQESSISSTEILNFPLFEILSLQQKSRQLIGEIINKLNQHKNIKNKIINKQLNFFESDPIEAITIENEQHQNNLLVLRWLRLRLRSCWSSIQNMLSQFPIRKGETNIVVTEDSKLATVEALNAFIPLAIKLGMIPEIFWAFEQISERICILEDLRESANRVVSSTNITVAGQDLKSVRRFINRPELLAIQGLIENAIPALKIVPNVAKHIVRCIQFLWELERWHFKLAKTTIESIYEPSLPINASIGCNSPLSQLINSKMAVGKELSHSEIVKIMDHFLALIDNIFLSATKMLPLDSLCAFLSEICTANENNLLYSSTIQTETVAQFLQRICQIICSNNIIFLQKLCLWLSVRKHLVLCASSRIAIPSEINRRSKKQKNVPLETALQIGNIFLNFIEQKVDLIGTGWIELFMSLKLLIQRQHNLNISLPSTTTIGEDIPIIPPPLPALTNLIIEIFNKFLEIHVRKPFLFLTVFSEFFDALLFALEATGSFNWKVEQQRQSQEKEQNQYILILEKCENILLDYLTNSTSINLLTFPQDINFKIKNKLIERWEYFLKYLLNNKSINEICNELNEDEELLCSCSLCLRKWLKSEALMDEVEQMMKIDFDKKPPWSNKSPIYQILLNNLFILLEMLMYSMLPKDQNENGLNVQAALSVKLAENIADFIERLSIKIDLKLTLFCTISCIISKFERCISSPITANSTRALKQSLGILICSHPAISNLLINNKDKEHWNFCLFKGIANLAVNCIAKGGSLSLTGCALFQRLSNYLKNIKTSFESTEGILFASSLWIASNYSLFPIRILISQFCVDSSVDLIGNKEGNMRISYRLGLTPEEVEERVFNVRQLAGQAFQFEGETEKTEIHEVSTENEESNTLNIGANFPGKFAYLFLFENNNEGTTRLSMGLDELLDSLICHQLNIQIITEQLLLFNNNSELQKCLLIGCLYATIKTCENFEIRPGLKNLLQKLTDLQSPANLWNIYLTSINSLIKIEINQALNEQLENFDQKDKNLNKKSSSHIKQLVKFLRKIRSSNVLTKLLNLIEDNLNKNINNENIEKETEIINNIRKNLAEEIIFSDSFKNMLEEFKKKMLTTLNRINK